MELLQIGSFGPKVKSLQEELNKLGQVLAVDGDFGTLTKAAVVAFQRENHLVMDGIVGMKTSATITLRLSQINNPTGPTGGTSATGPTGATGPTSGEIIEGVDLYHGDAISDMSKFLSSPIAFVIHKATEGANHVDTSFAQRRDAISPFKRFAAYAYIHPNQSAKLQVDLLLKTVGHLRANEFLCLDWEEEDGMSQSQMNDCVEVMQDQLIKETGQGPLIYGSWGQLSGYGVRKSVAAKSPLWVADIKPATHPRVPEPWTDWAIWQYAFEAHVAGIGNPCDVNRFRGSVADWDKFVASLKV